MERYDSIIIGAGHNGLTCAAYLARAGQSVLVVEAANAAGGLAACREFHPGYHVSIAHSAGHFSQQVADDLGLLQHGLDVAVSRPAITGLGSSGSHVVVGTNVTGVSADDERAYRSYSSLVGKLANALDPFWLKTIPRIGVGSLKDMMTFAHIGLNIRRLGKKDMAEFLRVASLPARDLMDEYFDNDVLKAALSWDGLIGSRMAPRSPNSAVLALLYRASGLPASPGSIVTSLAAAAAASGAEFRYGTPVDRIRVEGGENGLTASGVNLADGVVVRANTIVSAVDPQTTFLRLVGAEHLEIGFTNRIARLRCNGLVAKLHLALDGLPSFAGIERPDGRLIIAPDMDAIEFAFDNAKYGDCSKEPVMEIVVPSLADESLAPPGRHVLSAHVMYVPRHLKGGWTDEARAQIQDSAIDTLATYAPGIREQILHAEFLTPEDLEHEYRVTGGHWHHTEFALDQLLMMRPTYAAAQYNTPIPGLFLCSAGSHPGGDLVGAAGHNAAQEILR